MYLMYEGDQGAMTKYYGDDGESCHPSRKGTPKPAFIARFKFGRKPWKVWVNFIVKNFTVEEYLTRLENNESPTEILRSKHFVSPAEKKELRKHGYPETVLGWNRMIRDRIA
jgi:hypothetical protein